MLKNLKENYDDLHDSSHFEAFIVTSLSFIPSEMRYAALRRITPQAESEDEALDTEVGGSPFWFCWSFRICPGIGILYGYDMVIIWLYIYVCMNMIGNVK